MRRNKELQLARHGVGLGGFLAKNKSRQGGHESDFNKKDGGPRNQIQIGSLGGGGGS